MGSMHPLRHLSIRAKITLWFSFALVLVTILAGGIVLLAADQIIQKSVRDSLTQTIEANVDEVEYIADDDIDEMNDVDEYISCGNGFIEIDDDFLRYVNEVHVSLYESDGTLVYGDNPISRESSTLAFDNGVLQDADVNGTKYYLFDRQLEGDGLEGLWIRGIVSEEQGRSQISDIIHTISVMLPILMVIAIVGGYIIARRAFKPVADISDAAEKIRMGNDLGRRIEIGEGNDEVHQLAATFNKMFERLEHSFKAERQFSSDASHELRTPLSVISAQCELSLSTSQTDAEYTEALETIQRQTNKMNRLVDDLLQMTRLQLNVQRYPLTTIDLAEVTIANCEDLAMLKTNGIELSCETTKAAPINGNADLVSQLIVNLVGNAYRYGKEHGHIHVTVAIDDGDKFAKIKVEDDGRGISDSDLPHIFDRFFQADESRSLGGTGLGLSISKEIMKLHGGTISVQSVLGKGTVFTCAFPSLKS